jgi:uncharacterized protein (TIGR00251 family)
VPPSSTPFSPTGDGLKIALRLQPGASRAAVEGAVELADGSVVLKVRVGEPPEGGKANAALIKLLAKTWKLPKSAIQIVTGRSQRQKTLLIAGDPAELEGRLERWLAGWNGGASR